MDHVATSARRRLGALILSVLMSGTAAALALAPVAARAQAEGEAPTGAPTNPSEADRGRAAARAPHWALTLSVEPLWESNVRFEADPIAADVGTRLRLALDRTHKGASLDLQLSGNASGLFYRDAVDLNHLTYGFDGQIKYRLSPRSSLRLSQALYNDYARNIAALTDNGLLLERALARTYFTTADLDRRLTPHSTVTIGARFDAYAFGAGLASAANGWTLVGHARLNRSFSRNDALWTSYEYRVDQALAQRGLSQAALLGWTRKLGARGELALAAGAGLSRPLEEPSWVKVVLAKGTARMTLGRQKLSATASRDVGQAYGLGLTRVSNGVALADEWTLSPHLQLVMSAGHTRSLPMGQGYAPFDTQTAHAALRLQHSRYVATTASYRLYRLSSRTLTLTDHQVTVGFALTGAWR